MDTLFCNVLIDLESKSRVHEPNIDALVKAGGDGMDLNGHRAVTGASDLPNAKQNLGPAAALPPRD